MEKNPYRLKKEIEPVLYDLVFEPDLEKFVFRASEVLEFHVLAPVSKLVLHAVDLKVLSAEISHPKHTQGKLKTRKISYDPKFETVIFDFGKRLKPGKSYRLSLRFDGVLNDQMHGFYRTSYTLRGKKCWGAATQFEATDARRAFVCVDEPEAKARFRATMTIPEGLTALSNMPVTKETRDRAAKKKTLHYGITPVMSSYLLCFVVADLEFVESRGKGGIPIRVWTTPGKKEQGRFALEAARHALTYFADWFAIPYALPKLDMVALPDFASGAMENWGLVTYRETALLVDDKNSSASAKQRVAEVIDHELAHQWFGNLVTMEWWTDLWLNEGFASYMGPKAVHDKFPEWDLWNQYVATEYFTALHDDALFSSHPIEIPVKNPHEIREIFDHITYNKGSAVNRMLEHYLGEDKFRAGLRKYLKRYEYRNAKTVDLWKALEEVSKQPVRKIMASFTKQEGYPLISADLVDGNRLVLSQKRFTFNGSPDRKKMAWYVPITYTSASFDRAGVFLLGSSSAAVPVSVRADAWLKVNPGQTGFYRVRYSEDLLSRLTRAVEEKKLPATDSLGILNDAFSLARSGDLSTSSVLRMLPSYREWGDYNVWLTVSGILGSVENLIEDDTLKELFFRFALELLNPVWGLCGWEPRETDSHSKLLLRSLVIGRLGHFRDLKVIQEAQARFTRFVSGKELSPNLRGAVLGIGAEHGGSREWRSLKKLYQSTSLQEEKVRVLRALTRFQDPGIVREILGFSLSDQVRAQDAYVILAGFGSNAKARTAAWKFIKSKWKKITQMYRSGSVGLLGHILEGSTAAFTEVNELKDVADFFRRHPVPGTERTRLQTLELIRANIAWKKRDRLDLQKCILGDSLV